MKVGLYVDVSNISMSGGKNIRYSILRDFACLGSYRPVHLNAYLPFDRERAATDPAYHFGHAGFCRALRDYGYRVVTKDVKWYVDELGTKLGKANLDMEMGVDSLLESDRLDKVIFATGDGDFCRVIAALQSKGLRVEVVGFDNVSKDLRQQADAFTSGYMIPSIFQNEEQSKWGELGTIVRGKIHYLEHERGYGFFRFFRTLDGDLWNVDSRDQNSPYGGAFFHFSHLPEKYRDSKIVFELASRDAVFEFVLTRNQSRTGDKVMATQIKLLCG